MNFNNKSIGKNRHSERGNAGLVAIIFLSFAVLTVLTIMASNSFRESRSLDKSRSKLHEKWKARSEVNTLAQIVAKDAPKQMETDVRQARSDCRLETSMPIFDSEDTQDESSPAVVFRGTEMSCGSSSRQASPTSIFGTFANWREARIPIFEATGRDRFALDAENIKIIQLEEIYRRTLTDSDVAYAVRYIVEAKFGNYRTRTNGEMILGNNIPTCGTSATLEVTPATVERGNPVEMSITYSYANRLQIFNSAGTLLHDEIVPEQSEPKTFVYSFTPASTDTYRVVASGSGGCQARSTNVVVTVTDPPALCPRLVDFSASSLVINSGETVTLSWNVQDAAVVTFEGGAVAAYGSQSFTLTATRTFTLTARDAANACPLSRQITVEVRTVPPSCAFTTPQIQSFSANPTSIAVGGSSTLTWNISNVASSGVVKITGANGLNQIVNASGTLVVNPPAAPGDYTYTITAENTCPDGTVLRAQATVVISVRACPPPDITAFTVNPFIVAAGGNQMITFAWNIGGSVDAVSISNGVGGGLPASGSVTVMQPASTTTYTLTAVGCGQTRTAQVTVTVTSCPPPVINSFAANPSSVAVGGNQTVRLSWSLAGTVDSISISGIGSVSGNYVDIPQPQVNTTYTLTAAGCGISATSQATINVSTSGNEVCSHTTDNAYYCDENTNTQFVVPVDVTFSRTGRQTQIVITPPPNYQAGRYHSGSVNISNNSGVNETRYITSDPRYQNDSRYYYYREGTPLTFSFSGGTGFRVTGTMDYHLDVLGGGCSVAGSQTINISFEGTDDCIAGLGNIPGILNNDNYISYPASFAALIPSRKYCASF